MKSHQVYLFRQTAVKYLNNKQKTEEMYPNTGHQNCGHMIKGDKQLPSLLPPTLFLSTQGASNFEMAAFLSGCISKTLFKGISQALKMIPRSAHYYWQECTEMLNIREGPALLFTDLWSHIPATKVQPPRKNRVASTYICQMGPKDGQKPQKNKMHEVDLWGSSGPIFLFQKGHLEPDHVQMTCKYLKGYTTCLGNLCQGSVAFAVFPDVQREPPVCPFEPSACPRMSHGVGGCQQETHLCWHTQQNTLYKIVQVI